MRAIPTSRKKLDNYRQVRWKPRWDRVYDPLATIVKKHPRCHPQEFPNLSRAFTTLLTLPFTTATAEKSFSALRSLKTCLRSMIKEDCLS